MKSENPYKVAYAQYTTKTVAPNISTTNVVEIGERHQDNIGNGMRATGEFVHSAFNWVAEHPKELAIGAIVTVAFLFGGELVAAGTGLLTYLVNLFAQTAR
ncbi:hypothetical protein D8828_09010 [Streptococcus intermedius]|uniref:Uncharacterized protein n=1 Tax=Streptococcus intermedius TaxID=1338 RepID=A0AAD1C5D7_STRIT|nr:hypothetical protein [Streptococcus intermedius]RSJ20531.1 hypothetical protein D8828_09010 [Streptococcus intermedius]BAW16132.1 hypothetical protein SITYG_01460 [Streptococcus intermedius]